MLQWRPGFIGYPDSGAYLLDAFTPDTFPFYDPLRVVGYGIFVKGVHSLSSDLSLLTLTQHALGVLSALALYAALRLLGVRSRWVAVVPAAVVALGGSQIMFEHAVLTESLWLAFLTATFLALAVAGRPGARTPAVLGGALAAGLLLGTSIPVRLPGVFLVPIMVVWAAVHVDATRRVRLGAATLLLLGALAPVLGFALWHEDKTGRFGLSRNGALNLYGRVAPWADCTKFTVPKGTEALCETRSYKERAGHDQYIFGGSPATARYGVGGLTGVLSPEGSEELQKWSRAAILGQPTTYLHAVLSESRRLIDPDAEPSLPGQIPGGYGNAPSIYPDLLMSPERDIYVLPTIAANYPGGGEFKRSGLGWLKGYEEVTRPHPLLMALMLALSLVGAFVVRGPERRAMWLYGPSAFALLVLPVATSMYDYRYVFPVLGFVASTAAIGGWGVVTAARRAQASSRS